MFWVSTPDTAHDPVNEAIPVDELGIGVEVDAPIGDAVTVGAEVGFALAVDVGTLLGDELTVGTVVDPTLGDAVEATGIAVLPFPPQAEREIEARNKSAAPMCLLFSVRGIFISLMSFWQRYVAND